jgi:hypothetical protein
MVLGATISSQQQFQLIFVWWGAGAAVKYDFLNTFL